jgi:hypothetical protein
MREKTTKKFIYLLKIENFGIVARMAIGKLKADILPEAILFVCEPYGMDRMEWQNLNG